SRCAGRRGWRARWAREPPGAGPRARSSGSAATYLPAPHSTPPPRPRTAGAIFGLCGYILSSLNLIQLSQAAAWAPWVIVAYRRAVQEPGRRTAALLALAVGARASTLSAGSVAQTAVAALVIGPLPRTRRGLSALGGAGALAI